MSVAAAYNEYIRVEISKYVNFDLNVVLALYTQCA